MADSPAIQPPRESESPFFDVWSRTERKYRVRAIIMLVLLFILFGGLCCFTFWLRTGDWLPFQSPRYGDLMLRSFRPAGQDQITLSHFLTAPISVQRVPIHGVIMGILFASLCSMPVLVTILYRLPSALVLIAMVIFAAALPWLGITILIGCVAISFNALRFSFRYASALIGLAPIAVYFVSASWEPAGTQTLMPQSQALLYAPWVLALLSSCIICALALGVARLINYRPGGIAPFLAMLFAVPIVLFHTQVGSDELEYRLLEQDIGPGSRRMFDSQDLRLAADRLATQEWNAGNSESYDPIRRRVADGLIDEALLKAEADRLAATERCDRFVAHYPDSRYIPNVYFLKGRAQDARIHRVNLFERLKLEFYFDIPSNISAATWKTLVENFPDRDLSAVAMHRLALLEARASRIDQAVRLLDRLLVRFDIRRAGQLDDQPAQDASTSIFQRADPSEGLGVEADLVVRQAARLREMLLACALDEPIRIERSVRPQATATTTAAAATTTTAPADHLLCPLSIMLTFDETDRAYPANLHGLARITADAQARGYALIRIALLEKAVTRRISSLRLIAGEYAARPAGAEALFYLGDDLQHDSVWDEAKAVFDLLLDKFPRSVWAEEAHERQTSLSLLAQTQDPAKPL